MVQKQIVFIESSPTDMLAKIAQVLKNKGYYTVLISLIGDLETPFLKSAYSKRIMLDFKFFKANIKNMPKIGAYSIKKLPFLIKAIIQLKKLRPYLSIVRTTPNWLCFLVKKSVQSPVIYFPYDIRSFCYNDLGEAISSGVPKFEIKAEKWCFENCDGIIHKGEDQELSYLNKEILGNIKIKCPIIHFLPYCLSEFLIPLKNKRIPKREIHIVFVGHIGTEQSWINSINFVLKNKIHLHLYGKTANLSMNDSKKQEEYAALLNNKYFHIHQQVDQKDLSKEISKYDYGIWMGYYDIFRKSITICTGNKLASYLEAGLPIIYFKNHEYIGKILDTYGAGIGITINSPLRKILENQNFRRLISNVQKARKYLTFENNIGRLEKFFEEVRQYKFKKVKQ
jgi:hypothetical protein